VCCAICFIIGANSPMIPLGQPSIFAGTRERLLPELTKRKSRRNRWLRRVTPYPSRVARLGLLPILRPEA